MIGSIQGMGVSLEVHIKNIVLFRMFENVPTYQFQMGGNKMARHRCAQRYLSTQSFDDIHPKVEGKYYVPRNKRDMGLNCQFQFEDRHKDRLVKVDRFCPTRELSYTPKRWELHKDPYRRIRHLQKFWSWSAIRRLVFPDLAVTATVAACLSYHNEILAPEAPLLLEGSAVSGAMTAIGLLAAFRLNASYGRYEEARIFWGEINNSARDLASNALMWLKTQEQKKRMLKLIQAFPVTLQFHLNEKGGHYTMKRSDPNFEEQKYAEFFNELLDIYNDDTHCDFVQLCNTYRQQGHVPLTVTSCMRTIIAENMNDADPIYNREMDEQVQRLVGCIGMCERVLGTPIPTCFTRHTSRLFFLWSNLLPFAMYSSLGPVAVIPGSVMVSLSVLGIEDTGVQLEEPFNILPLREYSDGIFSGINSIERSFLIANKNTNELDVERDDSSHLSQDSHDIQSKNSNQYSSKESTRVEDGIHEIAY
jgi:ion channel-forming bestrophin family protein